MNEADVPQTAIIERVRARAALAGNPSDGFGGAVFAVPVPAFTTTATLNPTNHGYELVDDHTGTTRFERWLDIEREVASLDTTSPHCLMLGAIAAVAGRRGTVQPLRLAVNTTIPMSVGLAGSSAIVIASIRALLRAAGDSMDSDVLALTALAVETDRLGITAGLQDRVVQVHDRPMLMRFDPKSALAGPGAFAPVRAGSDFRLIVAVRPTVSESSEVVHGDLRARFLAGDTAVTVRMPMLAQHAVEAAEAYGSGDAGRLGAAMDATFDIRASMIDLAPDHVEIVEMARAQGAHANYTGSGGAIVALCPTSSIESATRQSLKSLGCTVVSVGASTPAVDVDDATVG
jgi:glucuronokinase